MERKLPKHSNWRNSVRNWNKHTGEKGKRTKRTKELKIIEESWLSLNDPIDEDVLEQVREKNKNEKKSKAREYLDWIITGLDDMKQNLLQDKWWRPTKKSKVILQKLIQAFMMDCTIEEACAYAGIAESTYYDRAKKDKRFSELMNNAQKWQQFLAKGVIHQALLNNNVATAQWVTERRDDRYKNNANDETNIVNINMWFINMMQEARRERIQQRDWNKDKES